MERNPDEWSSVNEGFAIRKNINQSAQMLAYEVYGNNNQAAPTVLHKYLAIIYRNEFECARIEQVNVDRRAFFLYPVLK